MVEIIKEEYVPRLLEIGMKSDIDDMNRTTREIRNLLISAHRIHRDAADIILEYINGFRGYLNYAVIKKILASNVKYSSKTYFKVNTDLNVDLVNIYQFDIVYSHRYSINSYRGSEYELMRLSVDDVWSDIILFVWPKDNHDLLKNHFKNLNIAFTDDNVEYFVWCALLDIRDNIIGDCIDPWSVGSLATP